MFIPLRYSLALNAVMQNREAGKPGNQAELEYVRI